MALTGYVQNAQLGIAEVFLHSGSNSVLHVRSLTFEYDCVLYLEYPMPAELCLAFAASTPEDPVYVTRTSVRRYHSLQFRLPRPQTTEYWLDYRPAYFLAEWTANA